MTIKQFTSLSKEKRNQIYFNDFIPMGVYLWTDEWLPGENTLAYYPLKEDVLDYSGNNNNGSGNPNSFTDGVANYNGASTTLPYSIVNGNQYTLSVWIKIREASGRCLPINQHTYSSWGFCIYFDNDNWLYNQYTSNLDNHQGYAGSRNVRTHIVCQWTGSLKKMYVNGVEGTTVGNQSTHNTSTDTLYMGYDHGASGGAEDCCVSQLIVESTVWTADEITNYYNSTKGNYGL